jgi:hypothetical protein
MCSRLVLVDDQNAGCCSDASMVASQETKLYEAQWLSENTDRRTHEDADTSR